MSSPVSAQSSPSPSSVFVAAQAAPATDGTFDKKCPRTDQDIGWVECKDSVFVIDPGDEVFLRLAPQGHVAAANFRLSEDYPPHDTLVVEEDVGEEQKRVWINTGEDPVRVVLEAEPSFSHDEGETIDVVVSVESGTLRASNYRTLVKKNGKITVKATTLAEGKHPIHIKKVSKPKHGKVVIENNRKQLTYKPDKNFTGDEVLSYMVTNRRGKGVDTAQLIFKVK
ncbi:hypothetical protein GCM10010271_71800 [Streptomyces kurssanovii]|nr:hypothetical protein GCM10010271_71800 [Streptomyces kurssanovii]